MAKQKNPTQRTKAIRLTFGKYRNLFVNQITDSWYLLWLASSNRCQEDANLLRAVLLQVTKILRANQWKVTEKLTEND